jgi:predicted RNase H-like nuclease (RuvC/YqgF family)
MYDFAKRIEEVQGIIKRYSEIIKELEKDIEKSRVEIVKLNEEYTKFERGTLAARNDISKYKLSLMYEKLLRLHADLFNAGNRFDELNRQHIQKTIKLCQYEYQLEKLKELVEGSGGE